MRFNAMGLVLIFAMFILGIAIPTAGVALILLEDKMLSDERILEDFQFQPYLEEQELTWKP